MKQLWLFAGLAAAVCGIVLIGTPVASGANYNCTGVVVGGTINGNVNAGPGCVLSGTHVTGDVSVTGNGSLTSNGTTIDGNVEIQNDSGTNSICGTTIGGNLHIHNNSGTTTLDDSCGRNSVGGKVHIHNNSGQVTISGTDVVGTISCHNDSPAASTFPGGNTAGGGSSGECSTSATTHCDAGTSCTVTVDDGNTSATVTADGSGDSGDLTVTLSAPLADDGCISEGPTTPSGDIVTVLPPGGYGTGNPITAEITYNFTNDLQFFCKSNNNKPPYTELPQCEFGEDEVTPTNVPCGDVFLSEEGSNSGIVYFTSKDPAIGGHY
jgi:hypothetical protein